MAGFLLQNVTNRRITSAMPNSRPIGIFDSGIGGLSVLQHVLRQLPHENLFYFADSGFAPYGDKPEDLLIARSFAIAQFLLDSGCKALVVACNTATAAAIKLVREKYPQIPIIGVEPGLKPAAAITLSRVVGVLATDRTLASEKFHLLQNQLTSSTGVRFMPQACSGLADLIENGELDSAETAALLHRFITPLVERKADTLVLGCTHYPFVQTLIRDIAIQAGAESINIVDTGEPVARQLARLLAEHHLEQAAHENGNLETFTTGEPAMLAAAFGKLLQMQPQVTQVAV